MIDQFTNYKLPNWGYIRLPEIKLTDKEKESNGVEQTCSNELFLKILTKNGFARRMVEKPYIKENYQKYIDRVENELDLISELGFIEYLLLVWKVCNFCDQKGIARGFGRGSVGGSCVCFLLGIVERDPIKDNLFFERFISRTRSKKIVVDGITYIDGSLAPDVDIDVEQARRGEVVKFLEEQYPNRTCKISTVNTLSGRLLIKECGKIVEELSEQEVIYAASLIPKISGFVSDIEVTYEEEVKFKEWCNKYPKVYKIALKLRDLNKNISSHASGYVISYETLDKFLPLQLGGEKEITSSYEMGQVSKLTIKLDVLGLRCCTVIADVAKQLNLDIYKINVDDDPIIYDNLQDLKTPQGLFQIESPTGLRVTQKVKPKNIGELSDILAMARPGALSYVDNYVKYKDNIHLIEPVHPEWDKILTQTFNQPLYQEQTMALANRVFQFSLEDAEILRRAIGKKKPEEIKKWKEKIYNRAIELKLDTHIADKYWKLLDDSSKYSFNASHSRNYASTTALTAYLKFKYPQNFFLALLKESRNEQYPIEEITKIQAEFKYFNIELLPPHLLKSDFDFKIENRNIRFGLSSIKGISDKTIEKLIGFRKPHSNKFELFEAANACHIPIDVLSALIQAGAMEEESYRMTRSKLVLEANLWNILTDKEKVYCHEWATQNDFNFDLMKLIIFLKSNNDEKGKSFIKESRFETIKKKYDPAKQIYLINSKSEKLARFFYERRLLGFSYSEKLNDIFNEYHDDLIPIEKIQYLESNDPLTLVGVVIDSTSWISKEKKTKCLKFILSDETGETSCMAFNDRIEELKENNGYIPKKDDAVLIRGKKKGDTIFIDNLTIQTCKIYTKYSQLKSDKNKVENTD